MKLVYIEPGQYWMGKLSLCVLTVNYVSLAWSSVHIVSEMTYYVLSWI